MSATCTIPTKTRAEQTIEYLIGLNRPLSDEESDALYRALHADYVRKWKIHKAEAAARKAVVEANNAVADLKRVLEVAE